MAIDYAALATQAGGSEQPNTAGAATAPKVDYSALAAQAGGSEQVPKNVDQPTTESPTISPSGSQPGGIFSFLGDMAKKAVAYSPAITGGPMTAAAIWASRHPQKTLETAVGVVKGTAELPIQLTHTLGAEYARATGDNATADELMKPTSIPLLGEVKSLSASPEDTQAQTPMEDIGQALDIWATGGAPGAEEALAKIIKHPAVRDLIEKAGGSLENIAGKFGLKTEEKALKDTVLATMPKETAKVKEAAIGSPVLTPEGKYVPKVTGGSRTIGPSPFDQKVGESVHGIIDLKSSPAQQVADIKNGIKDIADTQVRPILKENKLPFNQATFNKVIDDVPVRKMFKSDPTNTYQNVKEMAQEISAKYPKTKEGSWAARQEFDREVEKQFPRVFDGSQADNAIKYATSDIREAWNGFITEGYPEGSKVKQAFDRMFHMYTAADNIAEKGASTIGKNVFQRLAKAYPTATKVLKTGATIAAGKGVLDVGKEVLK